ncbi:hypothetical protein N9357_06585 [bacterium]|nr:hypothetical protein [bacterium]
MRIYILLLALLSLAGCSVKSVETVYHEAEDVTRFTAKAFKTTMRNKEIVLEAGRECTGKVICTDDEIKLTVKYADRFSFLKGKDLVLETEQGRINLNERDYSTSYSLQKAKDGTSGVLTEQFLFWLSESEFLKAAHAEQATLNIGDYGFELSSEERVPWQIMMDKERLLEIMDEEQQREYGQYPHANKDNKKLDLREKRLVSEAAESTWKLVKDSKNPEDIRYFLEQFPNSPFAVPAKLKLKQLERDKD